MFCGFKGVVCKIEWQKTESNIGLNKVIIPCKKYFSLPKKHLHREQVLVHGGRHVSTVAQNGQTAVQKTFF